MNLATASIPKQIIAVIVPQIIKVLRPNLSEAPPKMYPKEIDINNATLINIPMIHEIVPHDNGYKWPNHKKTGAC